MARLIILLFLCLFVQNVWSQVYIKKQSRHRFAQLNLGFDIESSYGGNIRYINSTGGISKSNLGSTIVPRFIIGGTHFWGHADFFVAIPLYKPSINTENQEIHSIKGVETVFKYYPLRIENNKIRPYVGTSMSPIKFEQLNSNLPYPNGPELNIIRYPFLFGLTFNSKNHLIDLGLAWNYSNKNDYYITRNQIEPIKTPPLYATLSYKFILETTLSAEADWESGKTERITKILEKQKKLNGFFFGAGVSSAFWLKESSYNTKNRPYISQYGFSVMPDFTIGYYLHKPDVNVALAYRNYDSSTNSYGTIQDAKRASLVLEATKYLFDYNGFAPFLGPAISYENLSFSESYEGQSTHKFNDKRVGYGITFGWDIRPNRLQSWILRTNLRWFPKLNLEIEPNSTITFDALEFNFIQLIIYPERMF